MVTSERAGDLPVSIPNSPAKEEPTNDPDQRGTVGTLTGKPHALTEIKNRIATGIARGLELEGRFVARNPVWVIFLSLVFAVGGALLLWFKFHQEVDGDQLYTPKNAQSFVDRKYVEDLYGFPPVQNRVMVTAAEGQDPNLLSSQAAAKSNLLDLMELHQAIEECAAEYDGERITYGKVCFRPVKGGPCKTESILDAWNNSRAALLADDDVLATINSDISTQYGIPVNKDFVMGGTKKTADGKINAAQVFLIAVDLKYELQEINGETVDPRARAWDFKLVSIVRQLWSSSTMQGFVSNYRAVDQESNKAIKSDIKILTIGYGLIVAYTHVVLFRNSPVHIKSQLAIFSVFSVLFSIVTSFGLAVLIVPFNPVVQTLPFLLLGLGVDDTFVIVGAYSKSNKAGSVEDRIGETMRHAGASIFVTSFTDLIAFCVGVYTQLPALKGFCIFAVFGILFDFLFQITFFLAFLALDSRREVRAKLGCPFFGLGSRPESSKPNQDMQSKDPKFHDAPNERNKDLAVFTDDSAKELPPLSTGLVLSGVEMEGGNKEMQTKEKSLPKIEKKGMGRGKIFGRGQFDEDKPSFTTRMIGEWLPRVSLHPLGSMGVLSIELMLVAAAIYGCTNVYMDFRYRDWFTPEGSWLKESFLVESKYYAGNQVSFSIYTKEPVDGVSYFDHQNELLALGEALRMEPHVAPIPRIETWYEEFLEWLPESPHVHDLAYGLPPNSTSFVQWTREFLTSASGRAYYANVKFNGDFSSIVSSRIDGFTKDVINGAYAINLVDGIRNTAKLAAPSLQAIGYHYTFLFYDGYKVITRETLWNVIMAGTAVLVITLVLLADYVAALCVVGMVALTDVVLFGLTFNTVTSVNIVLAVGIAVDYSAHIAHAFMTNQGSRKQRSAKALHQIGGEVFSGACTTWLAIVIMGSATHYIFQTFFKMFFCIVVVGVWHGLVVLPVLLGYFGPKPYETV
ncbi:hypothetical protein BSKO_05930 [Bryopsis sp. KO-2023]|nr:hypothetical protein BSKO_05930 [Bryopsis sp. KO-2023]